MNTHNDDDRTEKLRRAIRLKKAAAARRARPAELPPRPAEAPARLGELQRSLWLAHQLDPSSPAYHLASAFRVEGELDTAALGRAFSLVVSRHRILRSTYRAPQDDDVLQVIHPPSALEVQVVEAEAGASLDVAAREAREPFDLETGPLLRLRLVEEEGGRAPVLLLVLHHMLADERSLEWIWKEVAAAYAGELELEEERPRAQYDDFVHWQRAKAPTEREAELDAWRRRLDPMPDALQLPFERERSERDDGGVAGRLLERGMSAGAGTAMARLAAAVGVSPFTAFAFAFRLLLQRYTDGARVAFATPASTRSHPATAKMIGYFLNPVVVSAIADETLPVVEALGQFGLELRETLAQTTVPFQTLTEALAVPRRPDRHPVFQAMFVYQSASPPPVLGEARLFPVTLDLGASKFDLTLFVTEPADDALTVAVEYRTDRFDRHWMERLLDHYAALVEALPRDLARATRDVPMLDEREREAVLAAGRGTDLGAPGELVPLQIRERARRCPDDVAVAGGGERRTYEELAREAGAIARALRANGVGRGDRVGLFLDRSTAMIVGVVGVHSAGAAYVPCDPSYPEARNRLVLEDAAVAAVVTTASLRERLPDGPWCVVAIEGLEPEKPEVDCEAVPPERGLAESDPAYLLYTSGSTGKPKGVVVTHGNLRASTVARRGAYDLKPERFLLVPSIAFDSSVAGLFWTLVEGGTLVVPTDEEVRDPRALARVIERESVTSVLLVPSLYAQLLDAGEGALRGLQMVIVAGEVCPPRLVEAHFDALPNTRLFNEYGPTEGTVWATVEALSPEDARGAVPIGRPIPGVDVQVRDGLGRLVPFGISGSATISGPTVADGYWGQAELTAERFDTDPETGARRYHTGDRMAWSADGRLSFLGRADEQIKLRGFRIEPGEVESALLALPEVEEAAVVARDSRLVAFVTTTQDSAPSRGWRDALRERLPIHMVPSRLVRLASVPRLPNGKIDRNRLRAVPLAAEEGPREVERSLPTTREQWLLALWEGLLGLSGIRLDDNFFELGGHSLLAVETALAIERDLDVPLSPADVFASPTVRELARLLEAHGRPDAPAYEHLFPIQPRGAKAPLIVAIPHFFAAMFSERFRGERPVYGLRGVGLRPEGNRGRWRTMEDLGNDLVDEILRRFPEGPEGPDDAGGKGYVLAGYSFGASMAAEAARVLEARGLWVKRLMLIAPMPLDVYRVGPLGFQLDALRGPVEALSPGEALRRYARANHPFARRLYQRLWRRLAIEPWRRFLCAVGTARRRLGMPLTPGILYADVRVERFRLHSGWRPGVVHAPTVVFNARETETDAAATWRPFFDGPFTVHDVPDPHLGDDTAEAARAILLERMRGMAGL